MRKLFLSFLFTLCFTALGYGWGFYGHKVIQQLAIYALPKPMQGFYYRHMAYLIENSVRPDERRNSDPAEAPLHFIDVDVYGPNAVNEMPESWAVASTQFPLDTLRKYGLVPWHVAEMKKHLTRAFQRKDKDSILYYSADLAHYIQDAHVPLHTTLNYDGQLSDQAGLHSLWESKLPELHLAQYNLKHQKATYLQNPEHAIWEVVRASHRLLPELLAQEKLVTQDFTPETKYYVTERNGRTRKNYTDAFARAYQKILGTTIEGRMQAAAEHTASFWYTCWVDGGKPNLETLLADHYTKDEKAKLKKERKAWKKGQLQQKQWLVTKLNR